MKKLNLLLALLFLSYQASAAVQLMATRVIYKSSNTSAALPIHNESTGNYLVQTWLENANKGTANIPLQVVPPILKLDAGKDASLRFIYSGTSLPSNQESLFWINIQEIPPATKEGNTLQIAIHNRIKLFFRPDGLNTNLDEEAKKLIWSKSGNTITIKNNGPMYISLNTLNISSSNSKNLDLDMIPPFSSKTVTLPTGYSITNGVSYSYINDFGGITEIKNHSIN
ncbi:molecular chaperone [Rosenbergiella sp. S61]|uniref:Molecular chaperone n=2 Tax=Rosenbergiella gaditana TaxID=2726987 RepID=A0ABS5SXR0_9GAMM|nr:molecular chaperone [Rosenbergiella gaditana]